MNPLTEQQRAHLRMLESLPVRTHFKKDDFHRKGLAYAPPTPELLARARALDGKMPRKDIARQLGISKTTLTKKLGRKHR
jgi:hypothetical protein